MNAQRPWVVIGNPANRRLEFVQAALVERGLPPAAVFSYHDLLSGRRSLEAIPLEAVVRIESPGEDFEVEKQLLLAGIAAAEHEGAPVLSAGQIAALPFDRGRILPGRQWYLGFRHYLDQWQRIFAARPDLVLTSDPADIATLFDKPACHYRCQEAGLPVPRPLPAFATFDQLLANMDGSGCRRVFLKPAHGSSASGVVALHKRGAALEAITSVELACVDGETRLYNSLRIRRYTEPAEVRELVEALLPQRLHAEEWLPKAAQGGRVFDVRIVVIAGEPRHAVVRTSRTPLTNLHLGNRRGDLAALFEQMPAEQWQAAAQSCCGAAACFPGSLQVGLDVLFTPGFRRHYLLEINAFGDLLPGVLSRGQNTYQAEVAAVLEQTNSLTAAY